WKEAHAGYDKAVADMPPALQGRVVEGLPYSAWQILEHLRLAQEDLLEFCVNPHYEEKEWPADYWPTVPEPPSADAWNQSVARFKADRERLQALAVDPAIDLTAKIAHGTGQTFLREILLVIDHNAYHVAELVVIRRLLGAWK
ncbi:MAG TPA: DinB family protein, partial [Vicinamibacterales bacterium]|nr:DinB family protein [Vicinamibacterales bacterium]